MNKLVIYFNVSLAFLALAFVQHILDYSYGWSVGASVVVCLWGIMYQLDNLPRRW